MMGNVTDRINLVYENHDNQMVELPFKIMVLSDFTHDTRSEEIHDGSIHKLEGDVDQLLAGFHINLQFNIKNFLLGTEGAADIAIDLPISSLEDFAPENILLSIPELNQAYQLYRQLGEPSISLDKLASSEDNSVLHVDPTWDFTDRLIAQEALWDRINKQLNAIIHADSFNQVETSWRSLGYIADHIDSRENIELVVCNISKQALMEDFEDSPDVTQSSLYSKVYTDEFGQFGGRPYSMIVADYEFGPRQQDIALLSSLAQLAEISHAPLLSAASSQLFGISNYHEFSNIRDVAAHFDQPQYTKWNSFRDKSFSRYVCLTLPKFQVRPPHHIVDAGFEFVEDGKEQSGIWANAAYGLATRFINSFKEYRWFINVSGEEYGLLDNINMHESKNQLGQLIPTEVLVSDRIGNQLINNGFTPLSIFRKSGQAGFIAVPSCHRLDLDDSDSQSLLNQTLETQIPYMLICSRFSQYIKVMQRENIGSWLTRSQINQSVNQWLKQYVSDMDNPAPAVRARRPLRNASVQVRDVEGKSGWFMSTISITPHFKYMGKSFTLMERGRLEKA
ncbi:type VI secretion system contractile sheath large subunit [Bermanella marisrubri]|nr:type VI secretion system contractile sheath large subunit [Bermanella marisrubri]QIZ84031.1 type VI secretion system contractile sheath large subunit [Bermanella marisrubri]